MKFKSLSILPASVYRRERRRLCPKRSRECVHASLVKYQACSVPVAGKMGQRWNHDDDECVMAHREWTTLSLAMLLGRSWAAVKLRRAFLGKS